MKFEMVLPYMVSVAGAIPRALQLDNQRSVYSPIATDYYRMRKPCVLENRQLRPITTSSEKPFVCKRVTTDGV